MEYTDNLSGINQIFDNLFFNDMLLGRIVYGFICITFIVFLFISLYKLIRKRWNCVFFILLSVSALAWSIPSLLAFFAADNRSAEFLNHLRYIGIVPMPALLALHISLQVSYRPLRPHKIILYLALPVFLIFIILRDLLFPRMFNAFPATAHEPLYYAAFYVYAILMIIKAYLLCFNVFYQMPPRARRSTKSTLISVVSLTLVVVIYALWNTSISDYIPQRNIINSLLPLIIPIAFGFIVYPLIDAMYIMPASDVIVTSREFVMKGLNTTVLVLNKRQQVLDWNRKDWDSSFPLPKPKYKEPYPAYLKRLLGQYTGKVSPHSADILIISKGGNESHFLLRTHEVGYKKKRFGYVVEMTEVSPIYTKLRYFEEIAHVDVLTGLNNRNAYIYYTQQIMKEENMPLLIMVGDLNELKRINDMYGHINGDELIITVASVIEEAKPENAFAARVGGDEFVVLVPGGSEELAEKFISRANALCETARDDKTRIPSVSWGFAIMTSVEQSYNELFTEADSMMYKYKKERTEFSSSGILPKE